MDKKDNPLSLTSRVGQINQFQSDIGTMPVKKTFGHKFDNNSFNSNSLIKLIY